MKYRATLLAKNSRLFDSNNGSSFADIELSTSEYLLIKLKFELTYASNTSDLCWAKIPQVVDPFYYSAANSIDVDEKVLQYLISMRENEI